LEDFMCTLVSPHLVEVVSHEGSQRIIFDEHRRQEVSVKLPHTSNHKEFLTALCYTPDGQVRPPIDVLTSLHLTTGIVISPTGVRNLRRARKLFRRELSDINSASVYVLTADLLKYAINTDISIGRHVSGPRGRLGAWAAFRLGSDHPRCTIWAAIIEGKRFKDNEFLENLAAGAYHPVQGIIKYPMNCYDILAHAVGVALCDGYEPGAVPAGIYNPRSWDFGDLDIYTMVENVAAVSRRDWSNYEAPDKCNSTNVTLGSAHICSMAEAWSGPLRDTLQAQAKRMNERELQFTARCHPQVAFTIRKWAESGARRSDAIMVKAATAIDINFST